jgi:hypothetical protein
MRNFLTRLSLLALIATVLTVPAHASTITIMQGSDTLQSSRGVINTNFTNLNTDKIEATVANTFTALQKFFAAASTTQLSVTNQLYVGGTATTTIDSTGKIAIPAGSTLTVPKIIGRSNSLEVKPGGSSWFFTDDGAGTTYADQAVTVGTASSDWETGPNGATFFKLREAAGTKDFLVQLEDGNSYLVNNNWGFGFGSTSPYAQLSIHALNGNTRKTLFAIGSSTSAATTTLFSVSNTGLASSTNLIVSGLGSSGTTCVQASASGQLSSTGSVCGAGGGGSYPFTPSTDGGVSTSATSTALEDTHPGLGFDVPGTSWYGVDGRILLYASSTNGDTILGLGAGGNNATTSATALNLVAIGQGALAKETTGASNIGIGYSALGGNTSGTRNTGIGLSALFSGSSDSDNSAFGYEAGFNNFLGSARNVFVGALSGSQSPSTGFDNTEIGYGAGANAANGHYGNTLIGAAIVPTTITSGHNNINLGAEIFNVSNSGSNQLNIGNFLYGTIPATTTAFTLPTTGKFGVGSSTPYAKLSIHTNNGDTATTLFAIGSSTSAATTTLFSVSNTGLASSTNLIVSGLGSAGSTCVQASASGQLSSTGSVCGGTGSTPGGATTQVQFNDASTFAGNAAFTFDKTTGLASSTAYNVSQFGSYQQNGSLLAYASSTNLDTIFGLQAGGQNATTSASALANSSFGYQALNSDTSGGTNAAFGYRALKNLTTGSNNTAFGAHAGEGAGVGSAQNVFLGEQAGGNTTAFAQINNVFIGIQNGVGISASGADANTIIGAFAGGNLTTGYGNTIIGSAINPVQITSGHNNINLGGEIFNVNVASSNQLNIGNFLYGSNLPATTTAFTLPTTGTFGVGSSTPFAKLSVHVNNGDTATTLFAIGSSTASATTTLFSIANTGVVVGTDATNSWTGRVSPTRSFGLQTGTTTAWTGTSTGAYIPYIIAPYAGTLRTARCKTDAGTLGVQVQINAVDVASNFINASTTVGKNTFTSANTFSAGDKIAMINGTPASTPTTVSCTFDATETP